MKKWASVLIFTLGAIAAVAMGMAAGDRWHPDAKTAASPTPSPPQIAETIRKLPGATPVAVKAGVIPAMGIKEMANFDYDAEKGGDIPDSVKARNNKPIRLHGFMMAMLQSGEIKDFALVPSLFNCCYGQPPGVQHVIVVHLAGKGVTYTSDEIWVEGTLSVDVVRDDGLTTGMFSMESSAASITPMN